MPLPAVSIALATYNGASFLGQQLESFLTQTLRPAELVVVDDASTDGTRRILAEFSRAAPFPVSVRENETNAGPAAAFAQAATACRGDLVAFSDQDDVWLPQKLERLAMRLAEDPTIGAVFCNAEIVDAELRSAGRDVWSLVGLTGERRRQVTAGHALPVLLKRYSVQGATLLVRRGVLQSALPIPTGWYYDAWIALVTAAEHQLVGVSECLQQYRQHSANVIGARSGDLANKLKAGLHSSRDAYLAAESAKHHALLDRLEGNGLAPDRAMALVRAKLAHLGRRIGMPASRIARLPAVAAEVLRGGYGSYATDWRSIALDLLGR